MKFIPVGTALSNEVYRYSLLLLNERLQRNVHVVCMHIKYLSFNLTVTLLGLLLLAETLFLCILFCSVSVAKVQETMYQK